MATSTTWYQCWTTRSDGCRETFTGRDGAREPNEPSLAQMNDTPKPPRNEKTATSKFLIMDHYKKLDPKDAKAVEWRRKIGGMMMNIMVPDDNKSLKRRKWILKELPEGYELWEHVKYKILATKAGNDQKYKPYNNVYERQDAYLYGHPEGRKKRFRSPADFVPHLLWLESDKDGDRANCSCKLCCPDKEDELPLEVNKEEFGSNTIPQVISPAHSNPQTLAASFSNPPPASKPAPTPAPTPAPAPAKAKPMAQSPEQQYDSQAGGAYLYRPGEVVWWENQPANNWRLGVIAKRGLYNYKPRYLIQPLSNPMEPQATRIIDKESSLRPWLAWSLPNTTVFALQNMPFESVPWDRVINQPPYPGQVRDLVVDGSILAARSIDASYSFFDRNEKAVVGPGEVHYNGMFLGGEKIWVGEPVRLRVPPAIGHNGVDILVLVVSKLIERVLPDSTAVIIVGDVYKWIEMSKQNNGSTFPNPDLPPRMKADLDFRNKVAAAANTGMQYNWHLLEKSVMKSLPDIKGRWYDTQTLVPILQGVQRFQQNIAMGRFQDVNESMNSRLEGDKIPNQRRRNRADTLGGAVPADFKVSRGLAGDPADDLFPDEQVSRPEGQFMGTGQPFFGV
ncbi:uncharacterized protein RSE6_07128 [Rhynchosporium secalis]|uniref:Uncharacterized protein n=1 Tax=Rhynchosporium secalis TaxID=38038 RepID=A0A1E1MC95_RHYSE|nr:uncharacterized protein RSE6_07128 [Rhynchosporium secalis]